jgi:hypothetical protein
MKKRQVQYLPGSVGGRILYAVRQRARHDNVRLMPAFSSTGWSMLEVARSREIPAGTQQLRCDLGALGVIWLVNLTGGDVD